MIAQPQQHNRRLLTLIGALLAALLAWGSLLSTSSLASAATDGLMLSYGGWTVGTRQLESGEFVYCIEPGAITPSGQQHEAHDVDELRSYSFFTYNDTGWSGVTSSDPIRGEPLRQINYILSEYGATSDAREAVAVQFAIWILRDAAGEAVWLDHHINWVEAHGGSEEMARASQLVSEARSLPSAATESSTMGALHISTSSEHGFGEVVFPAGTSELRIEGGVFADGSAVYRPGADAGVVPWIADLHNPVWESETQVRIFGNWLRENISWPARLRIYSSLDPDQQTLAWAVGPVTESTIGEFDAVTAVVSNVFRPEFSTRVVSFELSDTGAFRDTITLGLASDSLPWPQRMTDQGIAEWMPVTLEGVLYGPFPQEHDVQSEAPPGAPIVSRLQLIANLGPGEYEVTAPESPRESGYYYWVWSISQQNQASASEASLLPEGYYFSDDFGLPDESHRVIMPVVPVVEPPAPLSPNSPLPANLAMTGDTNLIPAGLLIGILSLATGTLLLSGALRRQFHDLQQSSSDNL